MDNIISLIYFDVSFALLKLEKQVAEKQLKLLLIRSDRKLFDADELGKYLSEVSINNTFILKEIVKKSIKVIDINKIDFKGLEKLERDSSNNYGFSTPVGDGGFFSTSTPFECITIRNQDVYYATDSEVGYKQFFEHGNFEIFRSQHLAHKCARLVNLITAAYPLLKESEITKKNNKILHQLDYQSFTLKNNTHKNKEALESVANVLKSNNFISSQTTLPQFKRIFSGDRILSKIFWSGTVNELHWFVKWLKYGVDEISPKIESYKRGFWDLVFQCFEVKNKKDEIVNAKKLSSNNSSILPARKILLIKAINYLQ